MHSPNDLLVLRQHLRNAVASLRTMVLDVSSELPESGQCLIKSLNESCRAAGRIDRQDKDPDLEAVWERLKARLGRFREAADTSYDLLRRWQADERPASFQVAAAFMSKHLFSAHTSAMGLLNHMITAVAFDCPADQFPEPVLASPGPERGQRLCGEIAPPRERIC
ncbi:hypothetical protein JCM15519_28720 [Fundidesulfovibrio butyratiphilus]